MSSCIIFPPVVKKTKSPVGVEQIDGMIRIIRGVRVMLDRDLAKIYGVPTKAFNQAVKRNRERFPEDFMFRLTPKRGQSTSGSKVTNCDLISAQGFLEVTICDLKSKRRTPLFAIRLHRIRCVDGCQHPKQRTRCSNEHFCCSCLCENA
jgi:hypothetical protein